MSHIGQARATPTHLLPYTRLMLTAISILIPADCKEDYDGDLYLLIEPTLILILTKTVTSSHKVSQENPS